jgi:hypothetical protein
MNTTRISHTGHNHPSTTAARTACRKAMKATPEAPAKPALDLYTSGNGLRLHYVDGTTTRCGREQPVFARTGTILDVDCKSCRNKYGVAHN